MSFLQGTTKVFETPLVEANSVNVPARDAVAFAFDIPLDRLTAGLYICQVNVIDDTGGTFSFPRQALLVRAAAVAAPPTSNSGLRPCERYFGPCSLFSPLAELRYGQCLHPELQHVPRFKWYCAVKTTYGPS